MTVKPGPDVFDASWIAAQNARAKSEAAKFDAEGEAALITAKATAAKLKQEGGYFAAQAQDLSLKNEAAEVKRAKERRTEVAAYDKNHVYLFNDSVSDASAKKCMDQLNEWRHNDPNSDLEIVFNSPGGYVVAGMALWDFIQMIRGYGHNVTTSTIGMAASMAGILLQAGDTRVMGAESWLLIHEASFGAGGKIGEVEDTVEWVKMVQNRILDIFARRCAGSDAPHKLSRSTLKRRWTRKDWWISSTDALDWGLVDEVR